MAISLLSIKLKSLTPEYYSVKYLVTPVFLLRAVLFVSICLSIVIVLTLATPSHACIHVALTLNYRLICFTINKQQASF